MFLTGIRETQMSDWKQYFPYKQPRDQQDTAIDDILRTFHEKRFYALEAGTGVGKSAIGYTVARKILEKSPPEGYEAGAIFVTTQKLLQDQYEKDFQKFNMRSLKSSVNYQCNYKKHNTCAESQTELKTVDQEDRFWKNCTYNCTYKNAKKEFLESSLSVTNFPYLMTESNYSGGIKPRQLLIIDEAHNVETELSRFIEVAVSEKFCKSALKLSFPSLTTHHQAYMWIKDVYWPKLESYCKHIKITLEKFKGIKQNLDKFASLSKQLHMTESHYKKIQQFLVYHTKENWIFDIESSQKYRMKKIVFKPIDVSKFAEQYLFRLGHKVLFMSATLLDGDKFSESLGIDRKDIDSMSLPSPFPTKNRPILHVPMGRMTAGEIQKTLPTLAEAVTRILEQHAGEKGIIHTHSYKISNFLKYNVKSSRLLFPESHNRDEILRKHKKSKNPTVLVSPSMTEGVDLAGDDSRFQVLCKIPYPFLGDKLVKKRMHKWKWWYSFQTAKTIIQSLGRSIRSPTDTAVTYILDSDWSRFYRNNHTLFAKDFRDCLK
jgi:ATP-dependent DNA helicase DinG